jgi:hypothetical protein
MTPTNTRRLALFTGWAAAALLGRGAAGVGAAREAGRRHLLPVAQGRRQGRAERALPHRGHAQARGAHQPVVFDADLQPQARSHLRAADHREDHARGPGIRAAVQGGRDQRAPGRRDPLSAPRPAADRARRLRARHRPSWRAPTTGRSTSRWRAAPTTCAPRWRAATPMRRCRSPAATCACACRPPASACTPKPTRACWR